MAVADDPEGINPLFMDWKANWSYYQMLTGVLVFVPMPEDVPLDMSMIQTPVPDALFASMSYSKVDANGGVSVSVSPFGPETYAMLVGLVASRSARSSTAASIRGRSLRAAGPRGRLL